MSQIKELRKASLTIATLPIFVFVGCAGMPQKATRIEEKGIIFDQRTDSQRINNAAALEAEAYNFVEIEFPEGSDSLSLSAKQSLDSVLDQAQNSGKIDEVMVLSWGDKEFSSKTTKKLSKVQTDLAEQRSKSIAAYLKSARGVSVDRFNMAEQPSILSKLLNTEDNRLRTSMSAAGLSTSEESNQYPSKASHAVILVKLK
jgi:hypothetical protein